MKDWPPRCPNGHPLGPGTGHYSGFTVCTTCRPDTRGHGHHYVFCNACTTRLWLEHPGAVWETWDGNAWRPVTAADAPPS